MKGTGSAIQAGMQQYGEIRANAGVSAFANGKDHIRIQFRDESVYLYDYTVTGRLKVEEMKRLALNGKGLTTFINRHVREHYTSRLR